jgi:hypothetical protein
MDRKITNTSTRPTHYSATNPDRPHGRPVPAHLREDRQTRTTPSRTRTKQAEALPATRSPSR